MGDRLRHAPKTLSPLFERKPTHVYHTASLYDYSATLEKLRRINVRGTQSLLTAARRHGTLDRFDRFVHWSTCGVFGKPYTARDGTKVNVPFDESSSSPKNTPDDATGPEGKHLVNEYSVSKWEQEKLMRKAHRTEGLRLTVVRPLPFTALAEVIRSTSASPPTSPWCPPPCAERPS